MTVQYALTRKEILQGLGLTLRQSPAVLVQFVLIALVSGVLALLTRSGFQLGRVSEHVGWGLAWGFGALVFLPVWVFLRGKTSMRTLRVGPDGIDTEIGTLSKHVPWRSIEIFQDIGGYLLIGRKNGNLLFVPKRAFSQEVPCDAFVREIQSYRGYGA